MKKIVIGFSKSTKRFPIFSWLIRGYQGGTKYSHVYMKMLVTPRFKSNRIIHAAEGQVSIYSETAFLTRNAIVEEFTIEVTMNKYREIVEDIFHEKAGESYSIWQNLGIAIVRFINWIGFKATNPWKSGWNCSEYVLVALREIYPDRYNHIDQNLVTPKDIHNILTELKQEEAKQK